MTRLLTLIATGLWVAPLCAFAAYAIVVKLLEKSPGQGGDMTGAAIGGLGIVAALIAVVAGFGLAAFLASRLVPADKFLFLQIADGLIIAAMLIGAVVWNANSADPEPLRYDGQTPLLELELRAPKAKLQGESFKDVLSVTFWGGRGADVAHPENIREEGEFVIFPLTIHLIQVNRWQIRIAPHRVLDKSAVFTLNLPLRPEKSTEWSDWTQSTTTEDLETLEWPTLRYRFRLAPR